MNIPQVLYGAHVKIFLGGYLSRSIIAALQGVYMFSQVDDVK